VIVGSSKRITDIFSKDFWIELTVASNNAKAIYESDRAGLGKLDSDISGKAAL